MEIAPHILIESKHISSKEINHKEYTNKKLKAGKKIYNVSMYIQSARLFSKPCPVQLQCS